MINLRYHLVSVTAVFLALGLGILIGSAIVDRGTVAFLEDRVAEVEESVDATNAENRRLGGEVRARELEAEALAAQIATRFLPGMLEGRDITLVAAAGADEALVSLLRDDLLIAGADVAGTLRLTSRLALREESERVDFVRVLGLREGLVDSASRLRSIAAQRVAGAIWAPTLPLAIAGDDPTATAAAQLAALREAGFIDFEPSPAPPPGQPAPPAPEPAPEPETPAPEPPPENRPAVILVGAAASTLPVDGFLLPLLRAFETAAPSPPLMVVEAFDADDDGPSLVSQVRAHEALTTQVATADHLDEVAGRLAVVLALVDSSGAITGHYGTAEGAQRLLPAPPG